MLEITIETNCLELKQCIYYSVLCDFLVIGNNVWLGANAVVMKNVLGNCAIIRNLVYILCKGEDFVNIKFVITRNQWMI